MTKIVWLCGLFALLLWSLASWGVGVLLTGGADFLAAQASVWAPRYPEVELAATSAQAWLAQFGVVVLWIIWGLGSLALIFGSWLAVQALRWSRQAFGRLAPHAGAAWHDARERLRTRSHTA